MNLSDRLAEILRGMPDEASVTLPVIWLRNQIESGSHEDRIADLTVVEVGEELDRSPSTVRGWLGSGVLRGNRLRGREWRVPPDALAEFIAREREGTTRATLSSERDVDLGAWRSDWDEERP